MMSSHRIAAALPAVFQAAASALLLALALAIFVPLMPGMPQASVDGGWIQGLHEGVAQGLGFGRELVFTFGPYLAVSTRSYHPGTDTLALVSGTYLALSFAGACLLLGRGSAGWWWPCLLVLLAAVLAVTAVHARDTVFFVYPLLVALAVLRHGLAVHAADAGQGQAARLGLPTLAGLALPLGLLPLVKGSFLIVCGLVLLLCVAYLLARRQPWQALVLGITPGLALPVFWLLSGQALADLPRYLLTMLPVVSGYSEAMALEGHRREIRAYLVIAAALLLLVAWRRSLAGLDRLFLAAVLGLLLFVAFKGGFVRHDSHSVMSAATLAVAAVLLGGVMRSYRALPALVLAAALNWCYVVGHWQSPWLAARTSQYIVRDALTIGLLQRWREPDRLPQAYAAAQAAIRQAQPLPRLAGSTDIYPHALATLLASDNRWQPRPVLQSYSAYTPALAAMNREHLLGASAPAHAFFTVEPIDQRFPTLDDGASWPVLLSHYQPVAWAGSTLVLDRRARPLALPPPEASPARTTRHRLGQTVPLPPCTQAQWVRFELQRSLAGRLFATLYKPAALRIEVELDDGRQLSYRLISGMARAGFLLSPLVETTADFVELYGGAAALAGKRVRTLRIVAAGSEHGGWRGWHGWQEDYGLSLQPLALPDEAALAPLRPFDAAVAPAASFSALGSCLGGFDRVGGQPPASVSLSAGGALELVGWIDDGMGAAGAAGATGATDAAAELLVLLQDSQDRRHFFTTRRVPRPDVAAHLQRPELAMAGFESTIDTRDRVGVHRLGLALRRGDQIAVCPVSASVELRGQAPGVAR